MFNFFKKTKPNTPSLRGRLGDRGNLTPPKPEPTTSNQELTTLVLHLSGLHCTSCAVNIDLALEDLPGVTAKTSYVKSETKIEYDPSQTTLDAIHFVIRDLGYQIL